MRRLLLTVILATLFFIVPANASPRKVFVSIGPQKWLVEQLGGELVTVESLLGKGQEPHTFEVSPKHVALLSRAALFFTVGLPFEDTIGSSLKAAKVIVVASDKGITRIPMHLHEDRHHDHHPAEHHQPGHPDPHIWLSPDNLITMAGNMAAALSATDPANATTYTTRLHELTDRLHHLDNALVTQLSPLADVVFYVFHPSFGYFAKRYNLHQKAVEIEGKSPTPKQLAMLIQQVKKDGVKVVFTQPQFDPKACNAFANATGAKVLPIDPLAEDVAANLQTIADTLLETAR